MYSIFDSFQRRGIFDVKVIEETFLPLFSGKDIPINVTMKEFYDITKIELHVFSTEITKYELIDISYKTHPDWRVIDAVYCSSSLPVLLSPLIKDGKSYTDGGLICNYPLENCINNGAEPDEVFSIKRIEIKEKKNIESDSTIFDYLMVLIGKILGNLTKKINATVITNEYIIAAPPLSIYSIYKTCNTMEDRIQLIEDGIELVNKRFDLKV
jgi:predicted acylesterase/phospholipase RssA